jgi:hypothetical protein
VDDVRLTFEFPTALHARLFQESNAPADKYQSHRVVDCIGNPCDAHAIKSIARDMGGKECV